MDENIKKFTGVLLVSTDPFFLGIKYKIITNIKDYETDYPCIVVENLDPDYYLLFGSYRVYYYRARRGLISFSYS